ncbi:glycosyltransferase family 2 protein, partial [Pseudothermotoga sp.]|uniref:glycosyltransferase family 2 protein n=1 Tax=Pseudothermotoga sp. TaxID=2033661 RepID=UPI0031F645B1
ILTKNEEKNIKRVIDSVRDLADEILVIDSGSTDRTVEIAVSLGANVQYNRWVNCATQRNFGTSLVSNDWILMLDADEEVSRELAKSIKQMLENPTHLAYEITRRTYYLGKF